MVEWKTEILVLLGTVTDSKITKRFGISHTSVARKRDELGITAFNPPYLWLKDNRHAQLIGHAVGQCIGQTMEYQFIPDTDKTYRIGHSTFQI